MTQSIKLCGYFGILKIRMEIIHIDTTIMKLHNQAIETLFQVFVFFPQFKMYETLVKTPDVCLSIF